MTVWCGRKTTETTASKRKATAIARAPTEHAVLVTAIGIDRNEIGNLCRTFEPAYFLGRQNDQTCVAGPDNLQRYGAGLQHHSPDRLHVRNVKHADRVLAPVIGIDFVAHRRSYVLAVRRQARQGDLGRSGEIAGRYGGSTAGKGLETHDARNAYDEKTAQAAGHPCTPPGWKPHYAYVEGEGKS